MQIPYRFRLYRTACIINLLSMGCMLLFMIWLLTSKNGRFNSGGQLLVLAFFIINYKNDKAGLELFTQARRGKPVPKTQRSSIKIFWVLQIIMQIVIGFELVGTVKRYLLLIGTEGSPNWLNLPGLISDFLGFVCFLWALTTLVLVWPFVKFVRRRYIDINRLGKPGNPFLLAAFEL
jgi:hypothetical protein